MHDIEPPRTSLRREIIRFDAVRDVCRNRRIATDEPYVCVFTHACTNFIRSTSKIAAMKLAAKMHSQLAEDVAWADLWKFITNVHCVHHYDEAINFELPYSLEILAAVLQEQALHEETQRRVKEWEDELRRGQEMEDARRHVQRSRRLEGS